MPSCWVARLRWTRVWNSRRRGSRWPSPPRTCAKGRARSWRSARHSSRGAEARGAWGWLQPTATGPQAGGWTEAESMPAAVFLLARRHGDVQPILRRRQRAGGERGEGTRRVVGLVEVQLYLALLRQSALRQRGVEETRGA